MRNFNFLPVCFLIQEVYRYISSCAIFQEAEIAKVLSVSNASEVHRLKLHKQCSRFDIGKKKVATFIKLVSVVHEQMDDDFPNHFWFPE